MRSRISSEYRPSTRLAVSCGFKAVAIASLASLLFASSVSADFLDSQAGTRPLGMGGCFVAVADDANAVYWNPGGMFQIRRPEMTLMATSVYGTEDLGSYYLSAAIPFRGFAFGLGWYRLALEKIYSEDTFLLSVSKGWRTLGLGGSFKILRVAAPGYEDWEDPAYGGAVSEMSGDVGVLWRPRPSLRFGCAYRNVNEPTFKLLSTTKDADKVASTLRIGGSVIIREIWLITLEVRSTSESWSDADFHAGTELWFYEAFALRSGLDRDRVTLGASVDAKRWQIDGALAAHTMLGNQYRLSLTLRY